MKQQITIPFNQFSNFRTENNSGFLETAENVRHHITGYEVLPALTSVSTVDIDSTAFPYLGSVQSMGSVDGGITTYFATENKNTFLADIYKVDSIGTLTKVTGISLSTRSVVDFCEFNQLVIAVQYASDPKKITVGATSGSDLLGSPPQCKTCCVINDFVIMANEYTGGPYDYPSRIYNSEVGDAEGWTLGDNLCDYNDYWELGEIFKLVGHREYATILSSKGVSIMQYVGGDVLWQIDLKHHHNTFIPQMSVVNVGAFVYYMTNEGFFVFDGNTSQLLGNNINKIFGEDGGEISWVSQGVDDYEVISAYDHIKNNIHWYVNGKGHYIYNITTNEFTTATFPTTGSYANHLYFVPMSYLDDLAIISLNTSDGNLNFNNFTTTYLTPDLQTGFYELAPGSWCTITKVKPISSGATNEDIDIIAYDESKSAIDTVTLTTVGGGRCRQTGRYFKFRVQSDSTRFEGLQVEFTVRGSRS